MANGKSVMTDYTLLLRQIGLSFAVVEFLWFVKNDELFLPPAALRGLSPATRVTATMGPHEQPRKNDPSELPTRLYAASGYDASACALRQSSCYYKSLSCLMSQPP